MEQTHICLIGAGKHSTANIIPSLRHLANVTVDAVCTRHAETARKAMDMLDPAGNAYDSIDVMLESEHCRDVVIVMQADDALEAVRKCIRANRRVFCEKPLGMNAAQAEEIRKLAEEYHVPVTVGFMKIHAPAYQMIRKAAEEKTFGRICSYHGTMNVDASAFCQTDREFMYYVGIHYIALIRHLFGMPEEIYSIASGVPGGSGYRILFRHPNNVIGSLELENRSAWTREYEKLTVTFENGYAAAEDLHTVRFHRSGTEADSLLSEGEQIYMPSETPGSGDSRDLHLRGFIGELRCFTSGKDADPDENSDVCRILDRILDQLA